MSHEPQPHEPTRLALVGAASLLGKEIKGQLAASGFPSHAVGLFDLEELAGVLTDYGEEARVFADTVTDRILDHELVCLAGDQQTASDYLGPLLEAGILGLDCTGAWLDDDRAFPWIPGSTAPPRLEEHRGIAIPHATAIALGATMAALGDLGTPLSATIFLPASELGDAGLQELSQQSNAVLNLLDVDVEIFGRRQAFDLWVPSPDHPHCAERLAAVLRRLELRLPAINVVSAPVFHGMALSVFVAGAAAEEVSAALQAAGFLVAGAGTAGNTDDAHDSPARVVGKPGMHTLTVRNDAGGAWIWSVVDNLHSRAAAALAAIHTLLGESVSGALQ